MLSKHQVGAELFLSELSITQSNVTNGLVKTVQGKTLQQTDSTTNYVAKK